MENFRKVDFSLENPYTSAFYYTDKGYLKYDMFTRSFYDNENSSVKVKYFFEEIKETKIDFDAVVRPVIKYLCENHHPHVTVIITPTNAELLEGKKSTSQIMEYVVD